MARQPRMEYEVAFYHVVARGDRRQAIYGDDEDRRMFVELMGHGFPHHVLRCQLIEQIQPELHTA